MPFGGCPHARVVIAGFFDYFVNAGVIVIGIMMEQDQFFGAAFQYHIDRFAPVAMAPAAAASFVFFGKVLRIVDQNVCAFRQLAHVLIEDGIAGFIVGGVNRNAVFRFRAGSPCSLADG